MMVSFIDPLPEPESEKTNCNCPAVIASHERALDIVIDEVEKVDYPGHDHEFGVIYVGGGRYWPGIVVGCRLLRHLGYQGPIEVWRRHVGNDEPIVAEQLAGYDVKIVDALEVAKTTKPRILRGWESKLHAIKHCRYRKILFLEADAYCIENPVDIIQSNDTFSFWSAKEYSRINWDRVWRQSRRDVPPVQGGQLLINREQVWGLVLVADWICQHSEFYFRHLFGDHDAWRLALSVTEYGYRHLGELDHRYPAMVAHFDGKPIIVHRNRSKLFRATEWNRHDCGGGYGGHLPREGEVWSLFTEVLNSEAVDVREVFRNIYNQRMWGDLADSGVDRNEYYLGCVVGVAKTLGAKTIVDVGCGDGRLTVALAKRTGCKVIGLDLIAEVFPKNEAESVEFRECNVLNVDEIPDGDILVAKDVLTHWPNRYVTAWLDEVVQQRRWKALVLTHDRGQGEGDTYFGGLRPLDPQKAPLVNYGPWQVTQHMHKAICIKVL